MSKYALYTPCLVSGCKGMAQLTGYDGTVLFDSINDVKQFIHKRRLEEHIDIKPVNDSEWNTNNKHNH